MRTAQDATRDPRRGDAWESNSGLTRVVVTNGRLQGRVAYDYYWAGDGPVAKTCRVDVWWSKVSGLTYLGPGGRAELQDRAKPGT